MAERKHPNRSEEAEDRRMTVVLLVLFGERSRAEMAAVVGISESSLTRYMSGVHAPTPKTFRQIAAALGFSSHMEEVLLHVRALRCLIIGRALPPEYPEGTGGAELGTALGILLRDAWLDR
jgi:transcriptional regulator with XRE-family HTH domain